MNFLMFTIVELALGFAGGWFAHKTYVRGLWRTSRKMQRKARGEK